VILTKRQYVHDMMASKRLIHEDCHRITYWLTDLWSTTGFLLDQLQTDRASDRTSNAALNTRTGW